MKCLSPGHVYELENFEHKDCPPQRLQFVEKLGTMLVGEELDALPIIHDGTTTCDVLEALIDRMSTLQSKHCNTCRENAIALTHLETALLWLNKRTADRKARGVEGKAIK